MKGQGIIRLFKIFHFSIYLLVYLQYELQRIFKTDNKSGWKTRPERLQKHHPEIYNNIIKSFVKQQN